MASTIRAPVLALLRGSVRLFARGESSAIAKTEVMGLVRIKRNGLAEDWEARLTGEEA